MGCRSAAAHKYSDRLFSDAELVDDGAVALDVDLLEISEQVAAMTDHFEQTSAAVVVLFVRLQVLGERVDPRGQERDLHLGGAGVALVGRVLCDDRLFFFLCECHFFHLKKFL